MAIMSKTSLHFFLIFGEKNRVELEKESLSDRTLFSRYMALSVVWNNLPILSHRISICKKTSPPPLPPQICKGMAFGVNKMKEKKNVDNIVSNAFK